MAKFASRQTTSLALRYRVNQMLAARGAGVRVVSARAPAERALLGNYFLVDHPDRHVIVRDHVDLHEFAREIGALPPDEKMADQPPPP